MSDDEPIVRQRRSFREDRLWRLRWKFTAPVDDVEIATGPLDQADFVPLLTHSLANESLADLPVTRIDEVTIDDFGDKQDREMDYMDFPKEYRYHPPPTIAIENEDGRPISLGQFVREAHAYIVRNMDEIKKLKGEMWSEPCTDADGRKGRMSVCGQSVPLPEGIGMWFNRAWVSEQDGKVSVCVKIHAESELDVSLDRFFRNKLQQTGRAEQRLEMAERVWGRVWNSCWRKEGLCRSVKMAG